MSKEFQNSDSKRSALISPYRKTVRIEERLSLESGGFLDNLKIAYEEYGTLNEKKSNVILICHAITGDSHVARHQKDDIIGWWDSLVGAGKYIDTNQYFVICSNILGSCRGTTGPHSINPKTGIPYGKDFPKITVGDMVQAQRALLKKLKIKSIFCVIGGSLGGFQALHWATHFPDLVKNCVVLASSTSLSSQGLAFDVIGRNAIIRDPDYNQGQYYNQKKKPDVGLAIARMLGHITYLSKESMKKKFDQDRLSPKNIDTEFEKEFSVGSYLAHQGNKFIERFDANSYIILSLAMDTFRLGKNKKELRKILAKSQCNWLVLSYTSDWLFPPAESKEIVDQLLYLNQPVSYCNIPSICGHDAFLLDEELEDHGGAISGFLEKNYSPSSKKKPSQRRIKKNTSIFFDERLDFETIAKLVPENTNLLDIGCQAGELLEFLQQRCNISKHSLGIEIDYSQVKIGLQKGLKIIQTDLNPGLESFRNKQFQLAIVSQTLQSVNNVEYLLKEVTRVAEKAIVSFPNFAFRPLREMLYLKGKAPKGKNGWYSYEWYNTPNYRFPSILDFQVLCKKKKIDICESIFLDTTTKKEVTQDPNLNADNAIFIIKKK